MALLVCGPAPAEDPSAFGDFTFRRVTVPTADSTRRITVQIAPREASVSATSEGSAPSRSRGASEWFWGTVDPGVGGGAERLRVALELAPDSPDGAPSLAQLTRIVGAHGPSLLRHTVGTRISPALALAVIVTESSGRSDVVSRAGAQGLMQLIPATAARFDVSDPFDPAENIRGGVAYLDWLLQRFDGDPILAIAAYNAGEGAVDSHAGVPPYQETRAYVPKVLAAWHVARALCATPPELISDGCVFTVPTSAD